MKNGIVIIGTLYNKKTGKVLAVGEQEALWYFLKQMQVLNPSTFKKKDFEVKSEYDQNAIEQAGIVMRLGYGNVLTMYSKEVGK